MQEAHFQKISFIECFPKINCENTIVSNIDSTYLSGSREIAKGLALFNCVFYFFKKNNTTSLRATISIPIALILLRKTLSLCLIRKYYFIKTYFQ